MPRRTGLRTRLLVAIGPLAALHLVVFVVLLVTLRSHEAADRDARGAARVAIATGAAQDALDELQSAERGVAIGGTGPSAFAAWQRSAARARAQLGALDRAGREEEAPSARTLAAGGRRYVDRVSAPLATLARADPARARAQVAHGDERGTIALRGRLAALAAHEWSVRERERERASERAELAWIIGAVGVGVTLLWAIGFLAYVRRTILRPLGGVADAARALAAGELGTRVADQGGIGEVGELARTFDDMAASLEEHRSALERQNAELAIQSVELVEAVRSAREGASVLRAVLDATPDAIALLASDGAVLVDNPPMRTVRDAFGAYATAIDPHGTVVSLHDANVQEERRDEVTPLGTERTFARYAAPVHDGRGLLIGRLLVLREVTGEREAERAKAEFFALVSHELRTPLTSILGYVELMLEEDAERLGDEHSRHLEVVQRNARRLLRLVGDLLFAAQVEAGPLTLEPGAVDLPQLVRDAIALACPRAERGGVALEATHVTLVEPCLGDRDRLAQVLDNLISNALKFTPSGGRVTVSLAEEQGMARIEVSDTGVGIPARDIPRLFDRFYRATNATELAVPGLGLGLTIVRAIVEGHGGTIGVRSVPSHGTTFTIQLPLRAAPVTEPTEPERPSLRYAAGGR